MNSSGTGMSVWIGSQSDWRNEYPMLNAFRRYLYIAALITGIAIHGFASPVGNKLLPLVPAEAEIVAGIEDPHNPASHGRLLLVTHNNKLDYIDWVALTSVDSHMRAEEVVQVSASSSRGELKEHMLLVEGSFDKKRIFKAAEQNGAAVMTYKGEEVLSMKPFPREQKEMTDTRWMAILDNQISVFGSPLLVQEALNRHAAKAETDSLFAERIALLHADINSWNVLVMSAGTMAKHVAPESLHLPWTLILGGADELTVGIHYGPTARIDFAAHTNKEQQPSEVAALFAQPQMVLARFSKTPQVRLEGLMVQRNRIQGSVELSGKQFDAWLEAVSRSRFGSETPDDSTAH
jgi:hypothetical protein